MKKHRLIWRAEIMRKNYFFHIEQVEGPNRHANARLDGQSCHPKKYVPARELQFKTIFIFLELCNNTK